MKNPVKIFRITTTDTLVRTEWLASESDLILGQDAVWYWTEDMHRAHRFDDITLAEPIKERIASRSLSPRDITPCEPHTPHLYHIGAASPIPTHQSRTQRITPAQSYAELERRGLA